MITVRHVLYPTDLSEASARAWDYAVDFARWYRARLSALHVIPPLPVALGSTGAVPPPPPPDEAAHREAVERFVGRRREGGEPPVQIAFARGDPATEIVRWARDEHVDLLVPGTHGRRGLVRWLLGSVTERLLRTAPCPVLAVPPHAGTGPPPVPVLLKRIVCAIDFSDASLGAAELAFSLAQEAAARVVLLHVVEALPAPPPPLVAVGPAVVGYLSDLAGDAREKLRRLVPEGALDWCEPEPRVTQGRAWREIVREAAEMEAGVVVMGVHGHGPLDRFFFGSTAHGVVRHASCPVLVVRPRSPGGHSAVG